MSSFASLRKLAGDSLIYGVSGIVSRFLSVFLVPIYTRVFDPAEYGVVSLVTNFFALLNIVVVLGLDNAVARWYYDTEDEADRKRSLNTFLWFCLSMASVVSTIIFLLADPIADNILREPKAALVLRIAAINLPLTVFTVFTWNLLRLQRRPIATGIFTVAISLVTIILNLVFILVLKWGIPGIFVAQVVR